MYLHLNNSNLELSYTMIMGKLDLDVSNVGSELVLAKAQEYLDAGASFIEFKVLPQGLNCDSDCDSACSTLHMHSEFKQKEIEVLTNALKTIKDANLEIIPAVCTSDPLVMEECAKAGAQIIVDPLALRADGATQVVSKYGLVALLCFDQSQVFEEEKDDPCAAVSEFFYERLDACINAKIERQRIILDPMLSVKTSVEYRLKMIGRLKTITSFGLPLSCELPRFALDEEQSESSLGHRLAISTAVALFAEKQGIKIIRTRRVEDIALALDTWQALNLSARPFKLSRAIARTLKGLKKKR